MLIDPESSNIRNVPGKKSRDWKDGESKPVGAPKSKKNFEKVLNKDSDQEREEQKRDKKIKDATDTPKEFSDAMKNTVEDNPQKPKASIFSLAQDSTKNVVSQKDESLTAVDPESGKSQSELYHDNEASPTPFFAPPDEPNLEKYNTQFAQEQPDLAYVNPLNVGVQSAASEIQSSDVPKPMIAENMQQLISQMVDKITQMTKQKETDTSITLKHPPLFEGAQLKITSFESARGEFNVTFENLNPNAQKILQDNSNALKLAMENRGYTVHMITTTTEVESAPFVTEESASSKREEREGQGEQENEDQG